MRTHASLRLYVWFISDLEMFLSVSVLTQHIMQFTVTAAADLHWNFAVIHETTGALVNRIWLLISS